MLLERAQKPDCYLSDVMTGSLVARESGKWTDEQRLPKGWQRLPARWQEALTLQFGLGEEREHTLEEIGQKLRISKGRVGQLIHRA